MSTPRRSTFLYLLLTEFCARFEIGASVAAKEEVVRKIQQKAKTPRHGEVSDFELEEQGRMIVTPVEIIDKFALRSPVVFSMYHW